jgi:hypothetical protein
MAKSSVLSTLAATETTACRFMAANTSASIFVMMVGSAFSTLDLRSAEQQASR